MKYIVILILTVTFAFGYSISAAAQAIIPAENVIKTYNSNPVWADENYKSRRLTVRGVISDISRDYRTKELYVALRGKSSKTMCIRFYFSESEKYSIMQFTRGQSVTLEGQCDSIKHFIHKYIAFSDCTVFTSTQSKSSQAQTNSKLMKSIVTIEGKRGRGTGFIANFNGKKVLMTNTHNIIGNTRLRFYDCDNNRLKFKTLSFAHDRDIAIAELKDCIQPALELSPHVNGSMMHNNVLVYGNSMGAGVNTRLCGTVAGIGPKVVEVTARFVPGNSGSPIILGNQVIGVATYAIIPEVDTTEFKNGEEEEEDEKKRNKSKRKRNQSREIKHNSRQTITSGTRFGKIRRFASRVDNLRLDKMQKYTSRAYKEDVYHYRKLVYTCKMLCIFLYQYWSTYEPTESRDFKYYSELQNFAHEWNRVVKLNKRYRSSGKNSLISYTPHKNLVTQKFKKLLVSRLKEAETYQYHYTYIANDTEKYLKLFKILMDLYEDLEIRLTAQTKASRSRVRFKGFDTNSF